MRIPRKLLFLLFLFGGGLTASAQSTFGSLSGVLRDPQGAVVPRAAITLHEEQTGTERTLTTGPDGSYTATSLPPGTYSLHIVAQGFSPNTIDHIHLDARQQLRLDASLTISGAETVNVNGSDAGTINTDDASISAALSTQDVLALPANYRGNGSTSPLNVVQTLPGVQPDSGSYPPHPSASPAPGIKFSLQGGLPSQSETTVDGISAQDETRNNVEADAFPSAESIAEIRVDGVNNNAQYGQPGEVTTITKGGTDSLHGSAFWYFQNSAFNATPFGTNAANKPKIVANDFGASIGGPVVLPHLYNGHNRLFFFGTYEGFRFPQSTVLQALVPTTLMKQGNFSQETSSLRNPFTGGTYSNATLPSINASSAAFLQFFPDPNINVGQSLQSSIATTGYNYLSTRRNDIDSDQFDVRIDRAIGQRGTLFGRYTFKNITELQPADLTLPDSDDIGRYRIFATVFTFAFSPRITNEFRFGFTLEQDGATNGFDGASAVSAAGFTGLPATPFFNGISHIGFDSALSGIGERLNSTERSRTFQWVDNVTLSEGAHTLVLGADIRHLGADTPLDFTSSDNYGNFFFNSANSSTGQEFADFLIGAPYQTQVDTVTSDNNGHANAFAFYGQDSWRATPNLTLTMGLRYEYHPAFADAGGNIGNFDPSVARSGQLIYPAGYAANVSPEQLANVNACSTAGVDNPYATNQAQNGAPCTPVLSSTEAGLPAGLRHSPTLRFMPRLGFAYRVGGSDRTVIRGGAGYYNITTSGALFYALTGTLQANLQTFTNTQTPTGPAIVFPNVGTAATNSFASGNFAPAYGSVDFNSAVDIGWHDPYSLQSNLSIDRDLGHNFGLRLSYVGLKTWHLVWQPNLNELPLSTTTRSADQPRSAFPFPNFHGIQIRNTEAQATYHSGQVELSRRFSRGLSFDSAYTFAKNLSDDQGTYGAAQQASSFVDEQGGYDATYSGDRQLDYGNVTGTRRHRWISSGVYELPFGRGRRFGAGLNRAADVAVGGWQLSNIFLWQSGPFLTAYLDSGDIDPSGTGSGTLYYRQSRPDRIGNPKASSPNRNQWFNPNAFACPGGAGYGSLAPVNGVTPCTVGVGSAPIGRFGTESVGDLVGPGMVTWSTGVSKNITITERVRLHAEGTFTNVLNHTNLADPNLDIAQSNFGQITAGRGSDFGGNRTGQVAVKVEF